MRIGGQFFFYAIYIVYSVSSEPGGPYFLAYIYIVYISNFFLQNFSIGYQIIFKNYFAETF